MKDLRSCSIYNATCSSTSVSALKLDAAPRRSSTLFRYIPAFIVEVTTSEGTERKMEK